MREAEKRRGGIEEIDEQKERGRREGVCVKDANRKEQERS